MAREYLEKLSTFVANLDLEGLDASVECKHFFNGAALYVDGKICASLTPVGLALKLSEETREKLFSAEQAVPLRYFPKAPIKKDYALFPAGVSRKPKTVGKLLRESIETCSSQDERHKP